MPLEQLVSTRLVVLSAREPEDRKLLFEEGKVDTKFHLIW
jgi:hypothetical protein